MPSPQDLILVIGLQSIPPIGLHELYHVIQWRRKTFISETILFLERTAFRETDSLKETLTKLCISMRFTYCLVLSPFLIAWAVKLSCKESSYWESCNEHGSEENVCKTQEAFVNPLEYKPSPIARKEKPCWNNNVVGYFFPCPPKIWDKTSWENS